MTSDKDVKCPECKGPCVSYHEYCYHCNKFDMPEHAHPTLYRSTHDELMAAAHHEWVDLNRHQTSERDKRITELERGLAEVNKKYHLAIEHIDELEAENERLRLQLGDKNIEVSSDLYQSGWKHGRDYAQAVVEAAREWKKNHVALAHHHGKVREELAEEAENELLAALDTLDKPKEPTDE